MPSKTWRTWFAEGPGRIKFSLSARAGIRVTSATRYVRVRCLSKVVQVRVHADSQPVDVARAFAKFVPWEINPLATLVIECRETEGLERRIRSYEFIRHVMDSWDNTQKNLLLIMPFGQVREVDFDLCMDSVNLCQGPPGGFTLPLCYFSMTQGWEKRWVTLTEGGYIVCTGSPLYNSNPREKEIVLCHMSRFDIYMPRVNFLRNRLRPPGRFCYALKRQGTVREEPFGGVDQIHFMSIEDETSADKLFSLIQGWRSWYLAGKISDSLDGSRPEDTSLVMLSPNSIHQRPHTSHAAWSPGTKKNMNELDGIPNLVEFSPCERKRPREALERAKTSHGIRA